MSQFAHKNLPFKKRASGLASHTLKLDGKETSVQVSFGIRMSDLWSH